jgi:hypothetical protein
MRRCDGIAQLTCSGAVPPLSSLAPDDLRGLVIAVNAHAFGAFGVSDTKVALSQR